MNKKIFKKIVRHISHSNKGIKIPRILYPEREWATGLMVSSVLFIAICAYSIYTYKQYECPYVEEDSLEEVQTIVYRESMVNEALSKFSNQQEKHIELIKELSPAGQQIPIVVVESLITATSSSLGTSSTETLGDVEGTNTEEKTETNPELFSE